MPTTDRAIDETAHGVALGLCVLDILESYDDSFSWVVSVIQFNM